MRQEIEALGQHMDNLGETIRQELSVLANQLEVMKRMFAGLARSNIQQRRALLDLEVVQRPSVEQFPQNKPSKIRSFDECLAALESSFPNAFKMWWQILETNRCAYEARPVNHCSVQDHEVARWFSYFMLPYMSGRLLDVGCGPQAIPSYLEDYPVELICGIDPIAPLQPHPFEYVQGVAEFLPWDDDIFDTVVAATSLDHVLSLDMTFEEILRVIRSNGVLLVWQSHVKNAQPYDPLLPYLEPVDQYHLFHFSEEWFTEVVERWFVIREKLCFDGVSYFYCLTPKV
jgi:SAM-dependent methyltransferase